MSLYMGYELIIDRNLKYPVFKLRNEKSEISLNSAYNPYEIAQKKVINSGIRHSKLILLIGFGSGYEYEAILENASEDCEIVVFEPSKEIFDKVVTERNLFNLLLDKRVNFIIGQETSKILKILDPSIKTIVFRNPVIIEVLGYNIFFNKEVNEFYKNFNNLVEMEKSIISTKKEGQTIFIANIFKNLIYLCDKSDISELYGIFKDFPAVIVSAGPSLKKHIQLLKEVKNKAVIIAVDTIYRVLKDNNIEPDIVLGIDFTSVNFKHYDNVDTSSVPYAFAWTIYPKCVESHIEKGGKCFSILNDSAFSDWISKFIGIRGNIPIGDSTSHAAFHLAHKMGCNPVALIGQDLAYTYNTTHCDGVSTYKKIDDNEDLIEVEGYYGGKVKTSTSLLTILRHFEIKIKESGIQVFNATEGGALIRGAKNIRFKDFIDRFCKRERNFSKEIIDKSLNGNYFNYEDFRDELLFLYKRVSRMGILAVKGLKAVKREYEALCIEQKETLRKENEIINDIYIEIQRDKELLKIIQSDIDMALIKIRWESDLDINYKYSFMKDIEKDEYFFKSLLNACINLRKIIYFLSNKIKDRKNDKDLVDFVFKKIGVQNEYSISSSNF